MKSTRKSMFWRAILCLGINFWIARSESSGCSETGIKQDIQLNITCDNHLDVYADGKYIGGEEYPTIGKYVISTGSEVIAVKCRGHPTNVKLRCKGTASFHDGAGNCEGDYSEARREAPYSGNAILASLGNGLITDHTWKCTTNLEPGWNMKTFDDLDWPSAKELSTNSHVGLVIPWGQKLDIADDAKFIWTDSPNNDIEIYCRRLLVTRCSERRFHFFTTRNEWKDKALKNSVMKKTTVRSVLECGMSCLNTPGCSSFNTEYDTTRKERFCELNNQKGAASTSSRKGFQYFEITKVGY